MAGALTEKSRLSLPLTLAGALLVSAITGTAAAFSSAYALRDQTLEATRSEVSRAVREEREERSEALTHYLTREAFGEWRQTERVRSDQQYYSLLAAIERLSGRLSR